MKSLFGVVIIFVYIALVISVPLAPTRLRVEYMSQPIGVDVAQPRFSFAPTNDDRAQSVAGYQIQVTIEKYGASKLVWDSGTVTDGRNSTANCVYDGPNLISATPYSWRARWLDRTEVWSPWSSSEPFETGLFDPSDWLDAQWIGGNGLLRSEFITSAAQIVRARAYVIGLGYYELRLNGQKVGDHMLGHFTTFEIRILYDTFDVTDLIRDGGDVNAIGVMLGNGWYSQPSVNVGKPTFRLRLLLEYANGAVQNVLSSTDFTTADSPITFDDLYIGEVYDARLLQAGWDRPYFANKTEWTRAVLTTPVPTALLSSASIAPAVRAVETYSPRLIYESAPGVYVVDFGQNMAGVARLRVRGPAGTNVVLQHAESLRPDGSVHVNEYGNSPMWANYTLAGTDEYELYTPRFTYFGFRYIQVTGFPGVPDDAAFTAHFVHSDLDYTGSIIFGEHTLLNKIQAATRFAALSNFIDIPTDCPQRERRGWMGDAQLSAETDIHNFDMAGAYTKFLQDIKDSQKFYMADYHGAVPDCVPFYNHGGLPSDPSWGVAYPRLFWLMFQYYEDQRILSQHYDTVKLYADSLTAQVDKATGLLSFTRYGDWCSVGNGLGSGCDWAFQPEGGMTSTFSYINALDIVSWAATVLGNQQDAATYAQLSQNTRQLLDKYMYHADSHTFAGGYQEDAALAITLDLPSASNSEVFTTLVDNVVNASHAMVGIVGIKYLLPVLSKGGRGDLAFNLMVEKDIPSFGFMIEEGATTLWENWQTTRYTAYGSRNHIMFGSQSAWYYNHLAGIQQLGGDGGARQPPGWAQISFAPEMTSDSLLDVSASIDTLRGTVASSYSRVSSAPCGIAYENTPLTLTCATGVFTEVVFASYGTPSGTCGNFQLGSCNAQNTTAVVRELCVGKSACTIPNSDSYWGDPCYMTAKQLAVQMTGCPTATTPQACASVQEHDTATLTCMADTGKITSIDFASFGTPIGSCTSAFEVDPSCNAADSVTLVENACLGKTSCSVPATTDFFKGDPCPNVLKSLAIVASGCRSSSQALVQQTVTLPVSSVGTVSVQLNGATPADALIYEGTSLVWKNNAFVPGVAGISGAEAQAHSVLFTIGSGSYSFSVFLDQ
eukprot:TRINITY_DN2105_c0_g1_i1.p1 TRINITY_DN2105_c0_g1~~TRINITY_DN2105_c0_g1_i1.p1  ORF type:complete len:1115 (+),score=230.55 TRINITY_DN2105_c0_g1_i1:139-3483(+)